MGGKIYDPEEGPHGRPVQDDNGVSLQAWNSLLRDVSVKRPSELSDVLINFKECWTICLGRLTSPTSLQIICAAVRL